MTSIGATPPVGLNRATAFKGTNNGKGVMYGELIPDADVPPNYVTATIALRDFFCGFEGSRTLVDVTRFENGSPVITISGDPGHAFRDKFQIGKGALPQLDFWAAIHGISDPHGVSLNPSGTFSSSIGFYDASTL